MASSGDEIPTLESSDYKIDTREGELIINSARSSMTFYIGVFSEENAEYTIVASYAVNEHIIKAINGISSSLKISFAPKIILEYPHTSHNESLKFIFTKEYGSFNVYINYFDSNN